MHNQKAAEQRYRCKTASFRQVGQKIALVHAASLCAAAAALISNHVVTRLRGDCASASPCPWRYRQRATPMRPTAASWQKKKSLIVPISAFLRNAHVKGTGRRWKENHSKAFKHKRQQRSTSLRFVMPRWTEAFKGQSNLSLSTNKRSFKAVN